MEAEQREGEQSFPGKVRTSDSPPRLTDSTNERKGRRGDGTGDTLIGQSTRGGHLDILWEGGLLHILNFN